MNKLSEANISVVAAKGSTMVRKLASALETSESENLGLRTRVHELELGQRVQKLASSMEEKGLNPEKSLEEKIAALKTHPNLDSVEEAVKMAGASGIALATIDDDHVGDGGGSADVLSQWCVTGD